MTHLSLSQSFPMIIPLCQASLSQSGQLIRLKPLATLLFEEACRHKKLAKASTERSMFCGLLSLSAFPKRLTLPDQLDVWGLSNSSLI